MMRSKASSGVASTFPIWEMPALLTRMSDAAPLSDAAECRGNFFLIAHIAGISGSRAACGGDFFCDRFGVVEVHVENAHGRTTSRKHERDGASDVASATCDDCCFAIETEFALRVQRETPRFHGMKSSCDFN